jgi:hypothetical protein
VTASQLDKAQAEMQMLPFAASGTPSGGAARRGPSGMMEGDHISMH